jgi:L-fuconate dehydratase
VPSRRSWSTSRTCAGWALRRASCTWPAGAVINAAWDLRAKRAGQPLWQHLSRLEPEELVSLVDFRYLTDALTPEDAVEILEHARPARAEREERLLTEGYPAYATTPGWLGYSDDKLDRLAREAVEHGFTLIKLKVGADVADDVRRMKVARAAVGSGVRVAVDANQRWDVGPAIDWMRALAPYDPYWIEEPTSPDDVLGHAAIRRGCCIGSVSCHQRCVSGSAAISACAAAQSSPAYSR